MCKIKLRRYPTSEKSDLYELEMTLFDNGETDQFLLFVRNFQMTLKYSGALTDSAKLQYLCSLLMGEALCKLDTLCVEVGIMTTIHINHIFWV